MKNVPAIKGGNQTDWNHHSVESRWGYTIYTSSLKKNPYQKVFILPKETMDKIEKFTKPICMKRYNECQLIVRSQMTDFGRKAFDYLLRDKKMKIDVPEDYEEVKNKVTEDWKERLSHSGGTMIFQFNGKTGLFGDSWVRLIQVSPNEMNGNAPDECYKRISWLRYFLFEKPRFFAVKSYCAINNFINRKAIEEERRISHEKHKGWLDEMKEEDLIK